MAHQPDEKHQVKLIAHNILSKNGFYRFPINLLSEILELLEMPESCEPKIIQENALTGLLKIAEKCKQKYQEHLNSSKYGTISKEMKEFVGNALGEFLAATSKPIMASTATYPALQLPPPPPQQNIQNNPYPPMGYIRPPPPPEAIQSDPQSYARYMEEQFRIQQYYMYYYGMMSSNTNQPNIHHTIFTPSQSQTHKKYQPPLSQLPSKKEIKSTSNFLNKSDNQINAVKNNLNSTINKVRPIQAESIKNINLAQQIKRSMLPEVGSVGKKKSLADIKDEVYQKQIKAIIPKNYSTEQNLEFKRCPCKGYYQHEDYFSCVTCENMFHFHCLSEIKKKSIESSEMECYHCKLKSMDPLHRVKDVIGEYYICDLKDNKFSMMMNMIAYQDMCRQKSNKYQIQMRCVRLSGYINDNLDISWPDQCIVKLNGDRIIQIPALQANSSLKKRKDYSIMITPNIYTMTKPESDPLFLEKIKLSLEIKLLTREDLIQKKVRNDYTFAFAIYFIQKLNVDQLYEKIVSEERIEVGRNYIDKLMKTSENQVQIDKIAVTLFDPYTWDLIKTPARGVNCIHGQCFDLTTYLFFMASAKTRLWKCPVCLRDCRKFMIDKQQIDLLQRVKQQNSIPTEVVFLKNGTIVLKIDDEKQKQKQEEEQSHNKLKKTKTIAKESKADLKPANQEKNSNQNHKEDERKLVHKKQVVENVLKKSDQKENEEEKHKNVMGQ